MTRDPVRQFLKNDIKQNAIRNKLRKLEAKLIILEDRRIRIMHRLRGRDLSRLNALKASGEDSGLLLARLDQGEASQQP